MYQDPHTAAGNPNTIQQFQNRRELACLPETRGERSPLRGSNRFLKRWGRFVNWEEASPELPHCGEKCGFPSVPFANLSCFKIAGRDFSDFALSSLMANNPSIKLDTKRFLKPSPKWNKERKIQMSRIIVAPILMN